MKKTSVLISGASIAGPALAYWLRQYGFSVTVVERAPAPRTGGQAIDIRGAGREAAKRMGLLDQIRAAHTGVRGMAFINEAGRHMSRMPSDLLGHSGGVVAEIEILRRDLVQILYQASRDGVEYLFADSIAEMGEHNDGIMVTFERSGTRKFDIVVGADGLHSRVRALAFGSEADFVRDLGYYTAIFTAPRRVDLDGWFVFHPAPPGRMAGLYPVRGSDQARAMFFFTSSKLEYDRHNEDEQKQLLADVFAGVGWEVPRLLDAMWQAPDFYFDRTSRVDIDNWSKGRSVLLGDAAHCGSVGMGTSMALVGAYVLAGELAASSGDHRAAFARYQAEMLGYVRENLKPMPGGVNGFLPRTRRAVWLRNQMIRVLPHLPMKERMTGSMQRAASAITLKDYAVGLRVRVTS
jgi:2-polyprenyl-6-methoxyphenol hydroxylase-like FAD-dependent oxidoreductase